ncbi:TSUP family transporter [Actinomadura sp. NTSP31]|uniref:TSUP family transporter n=1 Tax=Actinomadura sp. NTSP31 TaxID=1735447 RepID=UPI0035BF6527
MWWHFDDSSVTQIAPAAPASTFLTSLTGAAAYAALSLTAHGDIAPDWPLGLTCGLGGLLGGYAGAHLQPRLPETALRLALGLLATALAVLYLLQTVA